MKLSNLSKFGTGTKTYQKSETEPEKIVTVPHLSSHLGKRSQAVGGAGGVGDDLHVRAVGLLVHAHHEHRGVSRRRGDDHL
jgi:hypothetical protein